MDALFVALGAFRERWLTRRNLALAVFAAVAFDYMTPQGGFIAAEAQGANLPYQTPATFATDPLGQANQTIQAINQGVTPGSMSPLGTPRNFLLNGAMNVNQQGTGIITCGTTSITALQFAADRWFCDSNASATEPRNLIITATPSPPPQFTQSLKVYRNTSGTHLQPVCTLQEIETTRATALQGQPVMFSAYLQALAGLTSASGAVNVYIITGTGTDEGIASLTATTAITPAWTGIAGGTTAAATFNLPVTGAAWARYNTPPVTIPVAATEVGVMVCFTPVGTAGTTNDGFAMVGAQLEIVGQNQTAPSPFEFRPYEQELREAERFFWQLNEPASGAAVNGFGQATGASATSWTVFLPVPMRGTTPVVAIPTTGTFKTNIAGTPTTWVTPTAGVCSTAACTITGGNTNTAGQAETLTGGGGTGVVYVKHDVVF